MKRMFFSWIGVLGCVLSAACKMGVLPLYSLKKIHKNCTSLRPSGRTSRFFCDLAGNGNRKKNSSHLHIFTQSAFTLIELLVSAACKIRVLPFYYPKIIYKNYTSYIYFAKSPCEFWFSKVHKYQFYYIKAYFDGLKPLILTW